MRCYDKHSLSGIYHLIGDQPFTIAYLRQHGLPGNIQRLVNDGHIICVKRRRSKSRPAVYQISDRNIRRFGADQIYANPQMICDLRDGRVSLRALSRETGFSVDTVKKYTEHSP